MEFQWLLLHIVVIALFTTSTVVQCRSSPQEITTTTTLDVSASIQKTLDVLTFIPQPIQRRKRKQDEYLHQNYVSSSSSSTLKVNLHSRDSIQRVKQEDYKSLFVSRLKRDSARVTSLNLKLNLAVRRGVNSSDLKPVKFSGLYEGKEIDSPIISGTSLGSGEYFSRIGIGRPAKEVYMVLDTGSDVNWLQCAPCADCYLQTDPIFEPASSSSYSPLSCDAQQCQMLDESECRNNTCLYQVAYGDGSFTVGDFVTETITFTGSRSFGNVAIGCGHSNEGLFVAAAGLLGLGGGALSLPSQMNASSFSYCLVNRDSDSASTLDFNSPFLPNAVTTSLLRNHQLDTFFYVDLTGLSVGGELLQIPDSLFKIDETGDGGIIIDSGTAVTRLRADAYNSLRDAFVRGTQHLPTSEGVALFDTCFDLSSRNSVEIPTVMFHFRDNKTLSLPADNYLIPVDSDGTFCFAFAPTKSMLSIIGNVQQQGIRVGFDLRNSMVGFSPNTC